jgi:NAD(P)-dependent dehydrogenase (short-subunit alcohol dehydrogenase family)
MTAFTLDKQAGLAAALAGVPMHRLGRPEDLAATLLYLVGRGGAYTTGAVIPVDGGVSAYAPPAMLSQAE